MNLELTIRKNYCFVKSLCGTEPDWTLHRFGTVDVRCSAGLSPTPGTCESILFGNYLLGSREMESTPLEELDYTFFRNCALLHNFYAISLLN